MNENFTNPCSKSLSSGHRKIQKALCIDPVAYMNKTFRTQEAHITLFSKCSLDFVKILKFLASADLR